MEWNPKKVLKRSICAMLSLVLAVTLIPSGSLLARAEGENQIKDGNVDRMEELVAVQQSSFDDATREGRFELVKGGMRFFENVEEGNCTSSDSQIVRVEASNQQEKLLFNREKEANNSFSAFSTTPQTELELTSAEFRVERSGDYYTLYNESEGVYLMNGGGASYFGGTPINHALNEVKNEDGTTSFEIRRASSGDRLDGRYVFFWFEKMRYDAVSDKNATMLSKGYFEFEFLEKKNSVSDSDPIPGYQRVSKIREGYKYLITKYYRDSELGDGIIVMYPKSGEQEQCKLFRIVETSGVKITAVGDVGQTATITIGDETYEVTIIQCTHPEDKRVVKNATEADCTHAAYTGEVYCTACNTKLADGAVEGEPLGHSYSEWVVTKEPTEDADGERSRTCTRCQDTQTEVLNSNEYITELLAQKIADAKKYREKDYTPETYAVLKKAYQDAENLPDSATFAEKLAAVTKIDEAVQNLERILVENIISGLKPNITDSGKKNYFRYTAYSGKGWVLSEAEAYIDLGSSDTKAEECYYEVHFEGNGISLFANKSPNHGKVAFTVDGEYEQIVDLYHSARLQPEMVYQVQELEEGPHVLKAVTLNETTGAKLVNQVAYAEISHQPYLGGTPDLGGMIGDTNTQYTQNRYAEVAASDKVSEELSVWKNDKATSELVLFSKDCSLTGVTVTAGDLTSGSNRISAEHVKTTFIRSTKAYNGSYLGYGDKERPVPEATTANRSESSDILYQQGGSMELAYDSLLPVWVEFDIPKDAKAGTYTGTLTATADGIDEPLTFTYTINVKDITLPETSTFKDTFDIELWQYPYSSAEYYGVEPFSEEHFNLMRSSMEIYKELGGHAITTSIVEEAWNGQTYSANDVHYPSMVRWEKNGNNFEYHYEDFDAWVEFCIEMGLGDKIVLYSIAPWHNSFTYWEGGQLKYEAFTPGSQRYNQVWGHFLRDLIAHLEEKGWFDRAYIGIDERGFSAAAFDLIESITNSKGTCLKTAGAMDGFVNKKDLALRVDDLNVGDNAAAAHAEEFAKLLEERKAAGLRTTLYSCTEHKPGNFSLSAPVESYWGMINAAKMGTAGFLRWAYDAWVEDPLNDATHNAFEPGDCFLIYPDEKDAENPISKSSVRLERMAEGIRDVNKLMYLQQEMPSSAKEIEALYDCITTTAGTSRSYMSATEIQSLVTQTEAFKAGLDELTDNYIQYSNATEPGLHLFSNSKEMKVGQEYLIPVKLVTDQADKTIVFQSKDPSVAYVDAKGNVTAKSLGSTEITLKAAGYTAVVTITVTTKNLIIKNTLTDYKLPEQYLSDVEKAPNGSHERHYLGQPDMVMLDDNQTLITVFPVGHGRGKIVMKVSHDAGETWEEQKVPDSWLDSFETPTIYKLNMTDGSTKLIVISGRPESFGAPTGGWDTSISVDNGKTWSEFETYQENFPNGSRNDTVVAMASLVQLKDESGNYIDKWMAVYHNGGSFVNYKTYLTFDEEGNQQWTAPEPYLSEYRSIESSHQICEVGMFRSPDEKRIVALARSQSHMHPATMFYSDDEGKTWSEPVDLPGSLAGERHKAMYDPTDPTGQRMLVTFREIIYDANGNNQFDSNEFMAGDWVAWVGTYDQLMNREEGMYRILLCEDWAANAKSGDTGYTGIVVQPDGTFIMDSYGHWDKEYSESLPNYNVYNDMCWIKQAKFKLSVFDEQIVPDLKTELQDEIAHAPTDAEKSNYTDVSFERMKVALADAQAALDSTTQAECYEALYQLRKMKSRLVMKGAQVQENLVTNITVTPANLTFDTIGSVQKLKVSVAPATAKDQAVIWKSDNPQVVAVSNKGEVMSLSNGRANITVKAADGSGIEKTVAVTVGKDQTIPVTSVTITDGDFDLEIGKTKQLTVKVMPENATNQKVSWSSSDRDVASIDASGMVTAKKKGTAKIESVTEDGGKKASVTVTVLGNKEEELEKEQAKQERQKALSDAEAIDMSTGVEIYTEETWNTFQTAYEKLRNLTEEEIEKMTSEDLQKLVKELQEAQADLKTIESSIEEQKKEKAKKDAKKVLTKAKKIDQKTGAKKYTASTWKAFLKAYNALNKLTQEQIENMSAAKLQKLADDLKKSQSSLKLIVRITKVNFAQKKYEIVKNKSINLAKEIISKSPSKVTDSTLKWKSSDTKIAKVTSAGVVKTNKKAVNKTAVISAINSDGKVVGKVKVKVMSGAVSKIKVKGKKTVTAKVGKTVTLKTTVVMKGKKPYNNKLKWASSNKKIATVSDKTGQSMKVKISKKAKKGQKVKITAKSTDGTNKKITFTIKITK